MKKKSNCFDHGVLAIVDDTTLSSNMDFMTKDRILQECDCPAKNICITITEKLLVNNKAGAFVLLSDLIPR